MAYDGPERRSADKSFDGPDKRATTASEVLGLRGSVERLTGQVEELTGQLEEVNSLRTAQQELDVQAQSAFDAAQDAFRKATEVGHKRRRDIRTIAFLTLICVALVVVAWRSYVFASHTRGQLNDLKGHSYSSCQTRNDQLVEVNFVLSAIVDIEDAISPPPGGPLRRTQLHELIRKLPEPINCAKVYAR